MGSIYKGTSKTSGRSYIGLTTQRNPFIRMGQHYKSSKDKRHNYALYRAIRKYGWNDFEWEILYTDIPRNRLSNMEVIAIELHNTYYNGYNCNLGGGSNRGYIVSKETKEKISKKRKLQENMNSIPIRVYVEGFFVGQYVSQKEAAEKLNLCRGKISRSLKTQGTHKGYTFVYADPNKTGWKFKIKNKIKSTNMSGIKNGSILSPPRGPSKYKGIRKTQYSRYEAKITKNKKTYWLGSHKTPEEAALAYNKKALELYGEGNCYLNKVGNE